jgi:hypothetical protein
MLVSWRAASTVVPKITLVIGAGACRGPLDARRGAKSIGLFAIKRKCDRKTACCAVEYWSSSSEENLKEGRTTATNKPTERNKDLSVIVLIKPAASGFKNLLHTAANHFFCLPLQTGNTLGEVEDTP